jgi:prefoldin alpha subunit
MDSEQEMMMKFQMFEQQIGQLQQQLQVVEESVIELGQLNFGLDELVGSKDKEIMAPIGRGIFIKAKLLDEELTVDVGGKNFVKKSIPNTKKILEEQIEKLEQVRKELNSNLEKINEELTKTFMDAQKKSKGKKSNQPS